MKKEIVSKLSMMKSKEATDYLHGAAEVSRGAGAGGVPRCCGAGCTRCWCLRCCGAWVLVLRARSGRLRKGGSATRRLKRARRRRGSSARCARRRHAAASPGLATACRWSPGRGRCAASTRSPTDGDRDCCGVCRLESGSGVSMTRGDDREQPRLADRARAGRRSSWSSPALEGGARHTRAHVHARLRHRCRRHDARLAERTSSPTTASRWLASLVTASPDAGERRDRVGENRDRRHRPARRHRQPIARSKASSRRRSPNGCAATPRSGSARARRGRRAAARADDRAGPERQGAREGDLRPLGQQGAGGADDADRHGARRSQHQGAQPGAVLAGAEGRQGSDRRHRRRDRQRSRHRGEEEGGVRAQPAAEGRGRPEADGHRAHQPQPGGPQAGDVLARPVERSARGEVLRRNPAEGRAGPSGAPQKEPT